MAVAPEEIGSVIGGHPGHGRAGHALPPPTAAVRLWRRGRGSWRHAPSDPATVLVADFAREDAWTVPAEHSIDDAMVNMGCAAVDALLVERAETVIGLVRAADLQGARSLPLLPAGGVAARRDTRVAQVMVPLSRLPMLEWRSIAASRVHHLLEWARNTRDTHALLMEQLDGVEYVRGLLSREYVGRSLGCAL